MLCGHPVPPRWALTFCSSMLGRELPLSMRLLWPFCRGRGTRGPQLKAGLPIHPMGSGWAVPAPSSGLPLPSLGVLGVGQASVRAASVLLSSPIRVPAHLQTCKTEGRMWPGHDWRGAERLEGPKGGGSASAPSLQWTGVSLTWTAFLIAASSKLRRLQLGKESSRAASSTGQGAFSCLPPG